jgi:hypothetical protein
MKKISNLFYDVDCIKKHIPCQENNSFSKKQKSLFKARLSEGFWNNILLCFFKTEYINISAISQNNT